MKVNKNESNFHLALTINPENREMNEKTRENEIVYMKHNTHLLCCWSGSFICSWVKSFDTRKNNTNQSFCVTNFRTHSVVWENLLNGMLTARQRLRKCIVC